MFLAERERETVTVKRRGKIKWVVLRRDNKRTNRIQGLRFTNKEQQGVKASKREGVRRREKS